MREQTLKSDCEELNRLRCKDTTFPTAEYESNLKIFAFRAAVQAETTFSFEPEGFDFLSTDQTKACHVEDTVC